MARYELGAPTHPMPDQYLFRQVIEFPEFEPFKQEAFYEDLHRFKKWRMQQVRYDSEFGIVHVPTKDYTPDYDLIEDDERVAKKIITKIYKERRAPREQFKPEEFKKQYIRELEQLDEMNDYHRRMTVAFERAETWKDSRIGDSMEGHS